ncbi:MAG TPA: phosphotransferase [Thermomicrobiales bacterium]|nr:phosphotransferase [Thermomicrobiales bacterium]
MQTWATPEWRAEMDGWIEQRLAERGIRVTGAIEQPHLYPWSTVMRVPTSEGLVYAKATMAGFDHEPRLTLALAGWRPDLMPDVLAIDDARGWMLTRDAGPMLRTITRTDPPNLAPWLEILPRYAELQIEMIPRRDELLALGAIDHRLATLPDQLALMLADDESLRIGPPDGLTDEEIEQLLAIIPRFAEICAELAGYGIPETLQHDDFHDGNIFIGGGRVIFADWAECCVAHPFITLRVTLRASAHFAGMPEDAAPIVAMRDAYLEPWTRFVPQPDLLRAFTLSQQIANVARTRTWHRVITLLTGEERRKEADTVPYNLRQFLATMGT